MILIVISDILTFPETNVLPSVNRFIIDLLYIPVILEFLYLLLILILISMDNDISPFQVLTI